MDLISKFRDVLASEPTAQSWYEVQQLLATLDEKDPNFNFAVDYARGHLDHWPPEIQIATLRLGFAHPGLILCRNLNLNQQIGGVHTAKTVTTPHCRNITHLTLRMNKMLPDTLAVMVDSSLFAGLKHLDLGYNEVGDAGLRMLCEAAETTLHDLEWLNLTENGITSAGPLKEVRWPNLKLLALNANQFGIGTLDYLKAFVDAHPSLTYLGLKQTLGVDTPSLGALARPGLELDVSTFTQRHQISSRGQ